MSPGDYARNVLLPRLISLAIAAPLLWVLCTVVITIGWAILGCAQSGVGPGHLLESLGSMWT